MGITDLIASFINEMLESEDGKAELQRTELADKFKCVPSQINYVISTRFSPERGYIVESRRGGGGYIRITRVNVDRTTLLMHTVNAIGDSISANVTAAFVANLHQSGAIDCKTSTLLLAATGDQAMRPVPVGEKDKVRASVFKQMLVNIA